MSPTSVCRRRTRPSRQRLCPTTLGRRSRNSRLTYSWLKRNRTSIPSKAPKRKETVSRGPSQGLQTLRLTQSLRRITSLLGLRRRLFPRVPSPNQRRSPEMVWTSTIPHQAGQSANPRALPLSPRLTRCQNRPRHCCPCSRQSPKSPRALLQRRPPVTAIMTAATTAPVKGADHRLPQRHRPNHLDRFPRSTTCHSQVPKSPSPCRRLIHSRSLRRTLRLARRQPPTTMPFQKKQKLTG